MYIPKLKSHMLKIMSLKISCLSFAEPPPKCKQTLGGQKLRQLRTPQGTGSGRIFQALLTQTDIVALIYRIGIPQPIVMRCLPNSILIF
jgi:hypothetical protein